MKQLLSACAILALSASLANASDVIVPDERVQQAHDAHLGLSGEVSIWGQGVLTTSGINEGNECGSATPGDEELCGNVLGAGGYLSVYAPTESGWGVIGDVTIDYHDETDSTPAERDEDALYWGVGLHLVKDHGPYVFGVFGLAAGGENHSDDDVAGPVFGGGLEVRRDNLFAQGGYYRYFRDVSGDDTAEDLFFIRGGGELEFGPGELEASAMFGYGDFDESFTGDPDNGYWVQLAAAYSAPVADTGIYWDAGYQGDFLRVDDGSNIDQAFFHTLKLGLTVPFGDTKAPFKTPNFRAPLANAGEFN